MTKVVLFFQISGKFHKDIFKRFANSQKVNLFAITTIVLLSNRQLLIFSYKNIAVITALCDFGTAELNVF